MVPRSRQFYRLMFLHAIAHKYMKTTCLCRPTALDFVLQEFYSGSFLKTRQDWKHPHALLLQQKKKRNRMQFENDLSNRTLLIWWNWFVEKNKKRKFRKLFTKQYVVVQVLCLVIFQITQQIKFEVIKQEAFFVRWVNRRVELHVFLGLPSIRTVHGVELKEELLMCVSLETTSEVTNDQEEMNNFYQQNKLVQSPLLALHRRRSYTP